MTRQRVIKGLKINTKKTKVMKISKSVGEEFMTMMGGKELTQVKQFTFLGGIITQEGDCGRDIRTRIACAKDAFFARKELRMKSFSLTLRKHPAISLVWSTLLYGAETWAMRKEDARRCEKSH
ncbi:PREDICTED: uncharacterized protein LOC107342095 [Acropora digitifera]|uniref:uncharacterized protein LOC107342095 n=1 Tax=Acropora digitifera TaxID=70779 RepID=UPI00077AEBCC|nr:PREDICTED: uncharacterized protein LOC107342095 [Acropora digitifera]